MPKPLKTSWLAAGQGASQAHIAAGQAVCLKPEHSWQNCRERGAAALCRSVVHALNSVTLPAAAWSSAVLHDLMVKTQACPAGFQRPNGTDLARMKSLLFTAKSKAVPVSARI